MRLAFLSFPGQESVEVELVSLQGGEDLPGEGRVHHIAFTASEIEEIRPHRRFGPIGA
ncbi:hypothetical protein HMSSN036_29560 [Paenibacillus macerans]|nr:hypothetical protein HMSSN036_29560 [Paenibacillus macerans]